VNGGDPGGQISLVLLSRNFQSNRGLKVILTKPVGFALKISRSRFKSASFRALMVSVFLKLCRYINVSLLYVVQISYYVSDSADSRSRLFFIPGFHTVCIEAWTTNGRGKCPYCRQQVIRGLDLDKEPEYGMSIFLCLLIMGYYIVVVLIMRVVLICALILFYGVGLNLILSSSLNINSSFIQELIERR